MTLVNPPSASGEHVAICVPTFKRPVGLSRLLESIRVMDIEGISVHLIVVDNDPEASARSIVQDHASAAPYPVTYIVESVRGLTSVRNRLVAEARSHGVTFIAFVDDDETVAEQWLKTLVAEATLRNADGVAGKTVYSFDDTVPESVRICFQFSGAPAGPTLTRLSTANLLYRLSTLDQIPGPFSQGGNLSGGEDVLLSQKLHDMGASFFYRDDAITYETVPLSRTTSKWILKRAYAIGVTQTMIVRTASPSFRKTGVHLITSLGRVLVGSIQVLTAVVIDRDKVLFRSRRVASGVGSIASFLTRRAVHHQYAEHHGE